MIMSEYQKMIEGKIYDSSDPYLLETRKKAHKLCLEYNSLLEDDPRRGEILKELLPNCSPYIYLQGPIYFDYGINIIGKDAIYANFNFTVLDSSKVIIGSNVYFGVNVTLATPVHPLVKEERRIFTDEQGNFKDLEYAKEIEIGDDCWICSNVVINGGVKIGPGTVIGSGSIVTKDIPEGVFAAGNPCKVIRKITQEDSIYLKKGLFK